MESWPAGVAIAAGKAVINCDVDRALYRRTVGFAGDNNAAAVISAAGCKLCRRLCLPTGG